MYIYLFIYLFIYIVPYSDMCAKLTHKFFVGNDEFPGGAFLLLWLHSDSMAMALPTCSNAYEKNKVVDR